LNRKTIPQRIPASPSDLIGYTLKNFHDGEIRITIKFNGALNEATLARAVRLTFDVEPVLGCRFVARPFRPYWQRCSNLEGAFEFHIIDSVDIEKTVNSYLLVPLDPFSGPQVKVGLFRSDFDTLCIKISHVVADGGASMQYLRLLSSIYRRLPKKPDFQPSHNLAVRRSSLQLFMHVGLRKLLKSVAHISVPKSTWQFLPASDGNRGAYLIVRRIEPKRLAYLKAYAKSHNVTVGDVLTTAYYRALFELLDPSENVEHAMLVPVNVRKNIPGPTIEGIRMFSASYFVKIARRKNESFEQTMAKVHASMESEKSKQSELGVLFLMELALAPGYFAARILGPTISLAALFPEFSNIGVVDAAVADFGVPVEKILPAGPAMYPPYFCLGSSTFNNEMALTATICGTEDYRVRVESFFDALVRELPIHESAA